MYVKIHQNSKKKKEVLKSWLSLQVQGSIEHFYDVCEGSTIGWLNGEMYYTAFTEGWALYAENPLIAEETDTYDNEPMQKFGMLQWQVCDAVGLLLS